MSAEPAFSGVFRSDEVKAAQRHRFSFICSMCKLLHAGKKEAHEQDWHRVKCAGPGCAGPLAGHSFPKYKGPLEGMLHQFCFWCGDEHPAYVMTGVAPHALAACEKHIDLARNGQFDCRPSGTPPKRFIHIAGHEVEL